MKIKYVIALSAIPVVVFASGNGNPPPSSRVQTIEDMKIVLFYLAIAVGIVGLVVGYLQTSLQKSQKRRTRSVAAAAAAAAETLNGTSVGSSDTLPSGPTDIHLAKVRAEIQVAREALQEEVDKVQRRSSLNLGIGILISIIAIWVLGGRLGEAPVQNATWEMLFAKYFPSFIACVFIELLAFFFLRLYRAGIAEMRTYGVDLKELTLKQVAIETVWAQESSESPRSKLALAMLQPEPRKGMAEKYEAEVDPEKALELIQKLASAFIEKGKGKSEKKDD